jgi:capsular exopolysaccharide synthesis family protein
LEEFKYIQEIEQDEKGSSFDQDRFTTVIKRLLPWIIILLLVTFFISYLVIRYTKPLYESNSVLKLNIKRDASILGLQEYDEEQAFNNLSSEMELLKSSLFFNKILDNVKLDVSIYTIGKILLDERYTNPPFTVNYLIKNENILDIPFRVDIIDTENFSLSYNIGNENYESLHVFGQQIHTEHFDFLIELTDYYHHGEQENEFYFYLNSRKHLLEYINENITVQPLNLNASTIQISFKGYNRHKARDLVNAIDTIYLKYSQEEKNKANSQKITFLNEQLETTETRLSDFENYFESFIINNKSIDLKNNLSQTIGYLNALDSQEYDIRIRLLRLNELSDDLVSGSQINLGISDLRILPSSILDEISELNEIIEKRESVLISHNENTQVYRKWTDEINSIYIRIRSFITEYRNELADQLDQIDEQRAVLEKKFIELPSKNTEYTKSQRYYALYEEFYLSLMQKKAEFQLAIAGTVTDFKILSPAYLPTDPLKPQKYMIYGIGIVIWILATFFIIGITYLSFNKITGIQELERLTGIPILGTVPFYYHEKLNVSKIIVNTNSKSAISEALRSIRTNMQFVLPENDGIITSISSTVSGEGKTFIGINLASVFALSGKRVLVMDMDLRKPKFQRAFNNVNNKKGISTILIGKNTIEECIVSSDVENLDLLPSGPVPPNPSELIMSERSNDMFNELKNKYDLIFMDTPPVGIVTDGVLVMKKADIRIYIIRTAYSKRQFVDFLEKINSLHKFDHLYIILNAIKRTKGVHYGYGYGSGYYKEKHRPWFKRILNL